MIISQMFKLWLASLITLALSCPSPICSCSSGTCTSCLASFAYFSNATCELCPIECATCSSSACNSCRPNYYLNSTSCVLCPLNCQICSPLPSITCTQCIVTLPTTRMATRLSKTIARLATTPTHSPAKHQPLSLLASQDSGKMATAVLLADNFACFAVVLQTAFNARADIKFQSVSAAIARVARSIARLVRVECARYVLTTTS